ncbi:hypothetical protein J3R30DRAFT_3701277 [Lentinula aciculospora]|uniref:Uncharacterized protein n=1 Tax=Lentinula aciculospora TaxID=153920 RepID=A0A9W9DQH6_9AGAR|nr:hypothetical protein J3R30DRAFT_3701277 [Lentinula aciculospora]
MSREPSPASLSSMSFRQSIHNITDSYRMRALSPSTSSSSNDSMDSTGSASTISTSTSFSSSSSTRDRRDTRFAPPELTVASSKSKDTHKYATKHVLIRARNANIPILLRHQKKKNTNHTVATRRRHNPHDNSDDDSEYEQSRPLSQRARKQKNKSQEQLEAEERRMLERKAELADDPLLDANLMCPDKVWCLPCHKYVQIDSRRQFYATLWYKHRGKRHGDVPLKRSAMDNKDLDVAMRGTFLDSRSTTVRAVTESPVALAVPVIDDALASNILAEMYSKAKGLRLLSLAAAALG